MAPWLDSFSTTAGSFIASTAALFSAATTFGGVLAGATMPYQFSVSRFGMPTSAVVGTSGALGTRCGAPTAIGLSLPALICGSSTGRSRKTICTCWASRSFTAGAAPR